MQLIWIQQWTALPVIVEDLEMSDGSAPEGRQLMGQQSVDPSAVQKWIEKKGYPMSCERCFAFPLAIGVPLASRN